MSGEAGTTQAASDRLTQCLGCNGKIKVAAARFVACPLCGLTLVGAGADSGLPPLVAPRGGQDRCWEALARERRLPDREGATQVREARLLLVPFWLLDDASRRSVSRPGVVVSAADLTPVGLPPLAAGRARVAGLGVEPASRTGDAMGRLEDPSALDAAVVAATLPPDGAAAAAGARWRLVYYPVWSFHYVVYNKEHYHVVDAVTAQPVGPARRVRSRVAVWAAMIGLLGVFLALQPLVGAAAAVPAWGVSLAAFRLTLLRQRAV